MLFDEIKGQIEGCSTPKQFSEKLEPRVVCVHTIPADVLLSINDSYQHEISKLDAEYLEGLSYMDKIYSD